MSPIASMSAVASVMITSMTISIEIMAATSNCGAPKWKRLGTAKTFAVPIWLKSVSPSGIEISVPSTIATSMPTRLVKPGTYFTINKVITRVTIPTKTFFTEPKSGVPGVPCIHPIEIGIKLSPMTVTTEPITSGGKNLSSLL
jgi:hypothetical protein